MTTSFNSELEQLTDEFPVIIKLDYATHLVEELMLKTSYFCMNCGNRNVWKPASAQKSSQCAFFCLSCGSDFYFEDFSKEIRRVSCQPKSIEY